MKEDFTQNQGSASLFLEFKRYMAMIYVERGGVYMRFTSTGENRRKAHLISKKTGATCMSLLLLSRWVSQ